MEKELLKIMVFQSFQDIANPSIFCEAIKTKTRLLKTIKYENALFEEAHH